MPERPITYRGTVNTWHCDHMGHMNVMWYVGKFDEATWQLFSSLGASRERLANDSGGFVAVEQQINYKRELLAGDVISIYSGILELKDKSIRFTHEMVNDVSGEVAANTVLVGVYFDRTLRRSCRIPEDIRERALRLMA